MPGGELEGSNLAKRRLLVFVFDEITANASTASWAEVIGRWSAVQADWAMRRSRMLHLMQFVACVVYLAN